MYDPDSTSLGLPVQLTRFVGREREIAEAERLLARTRLLTLTGAGGSGKTRLAIEVATRMPEEFGDGVRWTELAPLTDPVLLPSHVANQLGIREETGRTPLQGLIEFLRLRTPLLVLDNCEHLVEACAALVDVLLRACPGLKILATSREALGVSGETAWLVPPLSVPGAGAAVTPERLAGSEAVQLFVVRAQDALPSFALTPGNAAAVGQICRRLDGIPLAIELAAARVRVVPPEQIAARLDDAFRLLTTRGRGIPPRHQTLRATIDWSYSLLSRPEQLLLARLAVFAGGFTLEVAEAVCAGEEIEPFEVFDLLAGLVDRSLVVMQESGGTARYALLEIVRQYGLERLAASGEAGEVRRRHAQHFLALTEASVPHIEQFRSPKWMAHLAAEHDNLRAALDWALREAEDANIGLRLVGALWWFWVHAPHWSEGLRWCEAVLARSDASGRTHERAAAIDAEGALAFALGDVLRAVARYQEAASLWGELGELRPHIVALGRSGFVLANTDELEAALRVAEEAVQLARGLGDLWVLTHVLVWGLAFVHTRRGELEAADCYYAEAEAIGARMGYPADWGDAAMARAQLALQRGDAESAAAHARAAIRAVRGMEQAWYASRALSVSAAAAAHGGHAHRAARLLAMAAALRDAVGGVLLPSEQLFHQQLLTTVRESLDEEAFKRAWAEGYVLEWAQALDYAEQEPNTPGSPGTPSSAPVAAPPPSGPDAPPAEAARAAVLLRILVLGPLQIYREEELLPAERWAYAKPRELLFYLLAHPKGRTKEQIALDLWPDLSPAQIRNNLHVTLHHLRKALGRSEWVVVEERRYRLNRELGCEADLDLFEQGVAAGLRARHGGADPSRLLREALELYRGDFLEGEIIGDWHLEHRDRLRQLYLAGMLALGEALLAAGDATQAADVYRKVIARDELCEEAYRGAMQSLARAGDRPQALRLYQRLEAMLRDELGTEPDPETTALAESLQSMQPV